MWIEGEGPPKPLFMAVSALNEGLTVGRQERAVGGDRKAAVKVLTFPADLLLSFPGSGFAKRALEAGVGKLVDATPKGVLEFVLILIVCSSPIWIVELVKHGVATSVFGTAMSFAETVF